MLLDSTDTGLGSQFSFVQGNFDLIEDHDRRRFHSIPTTLQLPKEDVDALINLAPELMNEEPEFLRLLNDLEASVID